MSRSVRMHRWVLISVVSLILVGTATGAVGLRAAEEEAAPNVGSVEALSVVQMIPADSTVEVETAATIVVTFDRPVVPLTAISDPAAADLPNPLRLSPDAVGVGQWLNTSVYTFTPSRPLAGGTTYAVVVAAGLTAVDGSVLRDDHTWHFTTVRPKVVRIDPGRNEELVPVDTSIQIEFNMPIDPGTVADRLTVRTASLLGELLAVNVPGAVSVEGDTITFTPSEPFEFDRRYVVTLDPGVTGSAGGLGCIAKTTWRFQTVPLPRIVETDPKDGADDAYPYTSFEIYFNAPIDPDTVLPNLSIDPEPDPETLDGWYRSWGRSFVVYFGAEPSTDYTIRIGPEIADPYGNTTGQSLTVEFRTAPLSPVAWLHVPGRTSTLNASMDARIVVGYRNTDRLRLSLWRLDLEEYFEATSDWYDYDPAGRPDRAWNLSVSAPLNEAVYAPVDLTEGGGPIAPGIYVVELKADDVEWDRWNHRHLLIASPVNLTLKTTERQILAWATDLETGVPKPGLILKAYNSDGDLLGVSISDSEGLASFEVGDALDWRGAMIVGHSPFVAASTGWSDGISAWDLGLSRETPHDQRAFLDTDRPIYRPGQTVFFRGIVRDEDDASYTLPDLTSVDVVIRDEEWDPVYEETLPLDEFGGFSGTIELDEDARLGDYAIRANVGDRTFHHTFQVAAYRAPEFEVTVTSELPDVATGEAVRAVVNAAYFFGAPVADVPVEWNVLSRTYRFAPPAFGRYTFDDVDDPWICWSCWWRPASTPASILDGAGRTDQEGNLLLDLPIDEIDPQSGSRVWTIEATATGPSGETISGRTAVTVHQGSFYVGLAAGRTIGRAGEESSVDVVTVDWEANRIGGRALRYTVFLHEWVNVFEEGETGGRWTWTPKETEVDAGTLTTDERGDGRLSFVPEVGGSYKVVVEGDDANGRTVRSSLFLWVTGPESVSWRRTNDDTITLISDRTSYAVGDTAEILIPSPYQGEQWALVTVERGGILSREVVLLPTNSSTIRIPIADEYVPNVYVGVVLVEGRQAALAAAAALTQGNTASDSAAAAALTQGNTASDSAAAAASTKVGYLALSVDPDPRELRIDLSPTETRLEPGDSVGIDLRITDADGLPVEASLSLDLVDKAVLSLQPRTDDAILSAFYGRRGLGVGTASGLVISLTRLTLEQLEDLDLLEEAQKVATDGEAPPGAGYLLAGGPVAETALRAADDAGAEGNLPEGITVREEFLDTAYWRPNVVSDANGIARVEVELPDNLTTWVVRAVGATRDTLVGEATTEILVTKPLLIRPAVPRFLVVGDRVRLAASVSNQTEDDLTVDVTIAAVGVTLEASAVQTVAIPAGGETTVSWWATVDDVAAADLAFSAVSGSLSDAARPRLTLGPDGTLPVLRYTARETVGTAGELTEEESRIEALVLPETFDPDATQLFVRLEPSLAAAMTEGLSYLEHFEYECTEQLVSRFLPNALTYRALSLLGTEDVELKAKLDTLVSYALEELVERQNADGGWGWWRGDRSNPYLTAYVVFGLLRAAEADVSVDPEVVARGLDRIADELVPARDLDSTWTANRQAWLLYVLALGGETSDASEYAGSLFEEREKLSHYAKAYLALALAEISGFDSEIEALLSDLVNDAILSATGAHWEEPGIDWWAMNTDTRSTAVILDAFALLDPSNALAPNVVRWLMVARRAGIWETTQETAWALIALTDWMVVTGELGGAYELRVGLDDEPILLETVTPETVREPREIAVAGDDLTGSDVHHLTIARGEGEGSLYYTAHLTVGLPVGEVEPLDRGVFVRRQYLSTGDVTEERTAVDVGETFEVRLTIIAPNDLYYVVVEDPIPAGCEAVDTSLATTSVRESDPSLRREDDERPWWRWWWSWYSRSEFRDEKVVLFADYLPAGTYSYTYTLRGVTPGFYGALPSMAYEFYFPEVFGRSAGRTLRVSE